MSGVGGTTLYYVTPAIYAFVADDGRVQIVNGPVLVAQLRPDNQELPSLLGWDILERFEVLVDWRSRRVELR